MLNAFIVAFVVTAAIADVAWRKIPRLLTTIGLVAGIAFNAREHLGSSLLAAAMGFTIGLAFFHLGGIGGGDVKLITALGALLGVSRWTVAMEVAVFVAASMAIVQIVRRRAFQSTFANLRALLHGWRSAGLQAHPVVNVSNAAMNRAPFGVAAAVGTLFVVIRL